MQQARFKNDGRAHPSLVIDSIIRQVEQNIKRMTGEDVQLIVRKKH